MNDIINYKLIHSSQLKFPGLCEKNRLFFISEEVFSHSFPTGQLHQMFDCGGVC